MIRAFLSWVYFIVSADKDCFKVMFCFICITDEAVLLTGQLDDYRQLRVFHMHFICGSRSEGVTEITTTVWIFVEKRNNKHKTHKKERKVDKHIYKEWYFYLFISEA